MPHVSFSIFSTFLSNFIEDNWQLCFDTPMPTGETADEMQQAREFPGLSLGFRGCNIFQYPGTHRCLRDCDSHAKDETISYKIVANPHSLAKSDFFGNFYFITTDSENSGNRTNLYLGDLPWVQDIHQSHGVVLPNGTFVATEVVVSTQCRNDYACRTQDFVQDPTEPSQLLNKETSKWLPWSPEERYERNLNENEASTDSEIAPVTPDSLEIRALHVDIARNFHGLETLQTIIKEMAEVNMTHLHLHATDDEGWRIEIPELPELTTIGATRCAASTTFNNTSPCMTPQVKCTRGISLQKSLSMAVADSKTHLKTVTSVLMSTRNS